VTVGGSFGTVAATVAAETGEVRGPMEDKACLPDRNTTRGSETPAVENARA